MSDYERMGRVSWHDYGSSAPEADTSAGPTPGKRRLTDSLPLRAPVQAFSEATAGGSETLPYRTEMEAAFGQDLSSVRAYPGRAAALDRMGALAATHDGAVAFASSAPSRAVVAHEVAHVVQGRITGPGNGEGAEREAERIAPAAAAGERVSVAARPDADVHLISDKRRGEISLALDGAELLLKQDHGDDKELAELATVLRQLDEEITNDFDEDKDGPIRERVRGLRRQTSTARERFSKLRTTATGGTKQVGKSLDDNQGETGFQIHTGMRVKQELVAPNGDVLRDETVDNCISHKYSDVQGVPGKFGFVQFICPMLRYRRQQGWTWHEGKVNVARRGEMQLASPDAKCWYVDAPGNLPFYDSLSMHKRTPQTIAIYDAPGGQSAFGNMTNLTDDIEGILELEARYTFVTVLTQKLDEIFHPIFATHWRATTTAPVEHGWPNPGNAVYEIQQAEETNRWDFLGPVLKQAFPDWALRFGLD